MKVVLIHPTGNQNVRAVITALDKAKILAKFYTTVSANPNAKLLKFLPGKVRQEWLRRTFPLSPRQIKTFPVLELSRIILPKIGFHNSVQHERGWASVDAVYRHLEKKTANELFSLVEKYKINAVYAYEDGALEIFKKAKEFNLKCIYDLPIAYWETGRKLMIEEAERLPNWEKTLGGGIKDSQAKLERKTRELELADAVVGPSKFVMDSLPKWATTKQLVAPFGSPEINISINNEINTIERKPNRPLRILFVGSMGQRKGLGDLFEAIRLLNTTNVELVVMGSLLAPMEFYKSELPFFTYEPGRPYEQVLALMRSCDVFCLPSIVEGRALVMQEAMSQGLPLIITPNTGGGDLVKEGQTGFLVPIRSPRAIAEKISWFLDNGSEIPKMGRLAQEHAAHYTWEKYGSKITEFINTNL